MRRALVAVCFLSEVLALTSSTIPLRAQDAATAVERGHFRLFKFEQHIGEETYEISRDASSITANITFKFTDRSSDVPLTVSFRGAPDLSPLSFSIKGKTSRASEIDDAVQIQAGKARIRKREQNTELAVRDRFFTIAGYAPSAMQMLMVRYWASHGSPVQLQTLPENGAVKITERGADQIAVNGKPEKLTRYSVEGLIWGRETLWFDSTKNLVAEISIDAEFDHFESIRDGYESALPTFVARAGADNMALLAGLAKKISGSRAPILAMVGATLIDGTGRAPILDSVIVVENGRITQAGPRAKVKVPKSAHVIDARGKTILPGLWDMHAHFEQVEWGPIYLAAGVTTIRDCGNELEFITAARDAVAAGHGLSPRILAAGVVDGSSAFTIGVEKVDTPEQARMWTGRYHDAGFQQMKIYSSVKLEQLKAVADEAHRLGMTVTGHVPEGLNAYQAVEAGQDQINHIQYIADIMRSPLPASASRSERRAANSSVDVNSPEAQKAIAFLQAHGTVIDPTLSLSELFSATTANPVSSFEPGISKIAPELRAQLADVGPPSDFSAAQKKFVESGIRIVGALHRAGIPIVAGTDQSVPGHSLHRELELYVQAGFTPMEAIQAATIVPARAMHLENETGTVEPGKRADLIILDADPLADIHNTRQVDSVMANGVLYNAAELWRSVGFQP